MDGGKRGQNANVDVDTFYAFSRNRKREVSENAV